MTKKELLRYEKRLLAHKALRLKQRDYAGAVLLQPGNHTGIGSSGNPSDIAEQGYDTYEREMASLMTSDQTKVLMEIDEALRRIGLKSYGICESCGKPIARARLNVVPHARYCVPCMRKKETERQPPPPRRRRR